MSDIMDLQKRIPVLRYHIHQQQALKKEMKGTLAHTHTVFPPKGDLIKQMGPEPLFFQNKADTQPLRMLQPTLIDGNNKASKPRCKSDIQTSSNAC